MINQIAPVHQTKTSYINRDLIKARHIQAEVKNRTPHAGEPDHGFLWSPTLSGPFLVPVTRWIE